MKKMSKMKKRRKKRLTKTTEELDRRTDSLTDKQKNKHMFKYS